MFIPMHLDLVSIGNASYFSQKMKASEMPRKAPSLPFINYLELCSRYRTKMHLM